MNNHSLHRPSLQLSELSLEDLSILIDRLKDIATRCPEAEDLLAELRAELEERW